jgi:hypothetical protein
VDDSFNGTLKELVDKLLGRKAKLYVVVKRYKDTFSFEADLWEDEAPFYMTTLSPAPTKAATLVGIGSVDTEPARAEPARAEPARAEPARAEPARRKRARSPVTTPRRSQAETEG